MLHKSLVIPLGIIAMSVSLALPTLASFPCEVYMISQWNVVFQDVGLTGSQLSFPFLLLCMHVSFSLL